MTEALLKAIGLLLACAAFAVPALGAGAVRVTNLRCEYRTNPLGIDAPSPPLSWVLESDEHDQFQSGYRVLAASSLQKLDSNRPDIWDSGDVPSTVPFNIVFAGGPLHSSQRVYWKVRVFDRDNRPSDWSTPAWFETGLLSPEDWRAKWINDGKSNPAKDEDFYKDDPAPLFRKEFRVGKPVLRARLYVSGLGYYEASLNGKRVGDHVLDPGWTRYGARVFYSTYDVAAQLRSGVNCLGVMLGNGWYNPLPLRMFGQYNFRDALDVGRPRFIAQLQIDYEDGTKQILGSDESWKVGEGAIRFDNTYLGERVDARLAQNGWDEPGFDDRSWRAPALAPEKLGELEAQPQPPIRVTERIDPVKIAQPSKGTYIYDFGREFSGWASLRLNQPAGTKIVLRYGELLKPDGTLNVMTSVAGQIKGTHKNKEGVEESNGGPGAPPIAWQTDTYICRGGHEETYTPRFTFHAFRYMELTGAADPPPLTSVVGYQLNADVPSAGSFSCSNDLFNRIQEMVRRTFLCNLFSVQSDCPHREKLGYGGDIAATSEAFMLNFDMSGFYAKAAQDFQDAARPDGLIPDTAPFIGMHYCGVGWAMALPTLSTQLETYYGDRRTLAHTYGAAKKWLELVQRQFPSGIVTEGLSDHEALDPNPPPAMVTPLYYRSARMLEQMAKDCGSSEDAPAWAALAEQIRAAYRRQILDPTSGKAGPGTQGSQTFALASDLVPAESRRKALDFLRENIAQANGHLATGIFGTKFMLDLLSREGHAEDAYAIVNQTGFPGWGWMLENGATTLWEHWAKEESVYSHCHPMFGSVSQWFFNWLGGIQPAPGSAGFDRVALRPQFVKGLSWVHCRYQSMYGEIQCDWRRQDGALVLDLRLPVGIRAGVYLPDVPPEKISVNGLAAAPSHEEQGSRVIHLGSGRYSITLRD